MLASQTPIFGLYRAEVANTNDPEQRGRVVLRVPQVLGEALSNWAEPSDPPASIPRVQDGVWVQFSGGDVTKPVYTAYGGGTVDVGEISQDSMPPKGPTALALTSGYVVSAEGLATAWVQAAWVAPTENQDGSPLNDLSRYDARWSYDSLVWTPLGTTTDTVARIENLRPGVRVYVEVQSVDTSNNTSLAASANRITASASDGPPQPSTPTVVGVLGGIRVTWDGLTSASGPMPSLFDHVVIERADSGDFSHATTIGAMNAADSFYDSGTGYETLWNYRLRPVSKQSISGPASGTASASALSAGTTDIDANAIIANIIAVGGLDAQAIRAGAVDATKLSSELLLASLIKTAPFAGSLSHLEMDYTGLRFFDSLGALRTNFPTDPSQSSVFTGDVVARGVTVTGGLSLRGTNNEIAKSSKLVLQQGTAASNVGPTVSFTNPRSVFYTIPSNGLTALTAACYDGGKVHTYDTDGTTSLEDGSTYHSHVTVTGWSRSLTSDDGSAADFSGVLFDESTTTARYTGIVSLIAAKQVGTNRAFLWVNSQSTKQLTKWVVTNSLMLSVLDASSNLITSTDLGVAATTSTTGGLATDGTSLYVAYAAGVLGTTATVLKRSLNGVTQIATYSGTLPESSVRVADLNYGTYDFGSNRMLLTTSASTYVITLAGTTLTVGANESFPTPAGVSNSKPVGLAWDGSRFWTLDSYGGASQHSLIHWSTESSAWQVEFTWRQSTNGYETKPSAATAFTGQQRKFLTVTTPSIPTTGDATSDPDSVRVYLSRGGGSFYQQSAAAVGSTNVTYDAVAFTGTVAPTASNFPPTAAGDIESSAVGANGPLAKIAADGVVRAGTLAVGDVAQPATTGTVSAVAVSASGTVSAPTVSGTADVQVASRSLPRGYVGSASLATAYATTSASTTIVDVADLTVVIVAVAGRRYRITAKGGLRSTVAADRMQVQIREGATTLDTFTMQQEATVSSMQSLQFSKDVTPTAGSHTYKVSFLRAGGTGTVTFDANSTAVASLTVDDVGLA